MRRSIRAAVVAASLLLVIGLSGLVLAACGGPTTADAQAQVAPSGMPQPSGQMGDPSAMFKALLNTLVANDVITSSQADSVAAALGAAMEQLRPPTADASPGAQPSPGARLADPSTMFSSALDLLVNAGVITNAQKTAIVDALGAAVGGAPGAPQPAGGSSMYTF